MNPPTRQTHSQRQQPYTPIGTVTNPNQIITRLDKHDEEIERQKKVMDWTLTLTIGIALVCFIAFTTFIIDAWWHHTEADQDNSKAIESLKEENRRLREEPLSDRINALQEEINLLKFKQGASSSANSN
jgi:hypothetical protein